ncbi:hypothetical protein FQN50_008171 [Emmonsiellopsis sp. PD_5]|nr:hypothetical protein FQN50_008171 [Emmonsiellopsis sp. PD_5]
MLFAGPVGSPQPWRIPQVDGIITAQEHVLEALTTIPAILPYLRAGTMPHNENCLPWMPWNEVLNVAMITRKRLIWCLRVAKDILQRGIRPGVQFPAEDEAVWQQVTSAHYNEFDNDESVELQSDAAAVAAHLGKLGDSIVYLTNSAAGLHAQLTATKSSSSAIKGIVAMRVWDSSFRKARARNISGDFGPSVAPVEDFKKLAKLTAIQFVWGDNRPESHAYVKSVTTRGGNNQ